MLDYDCQLLMAATNLLHVRLPRGQQGEERERQDTIKTQLYTHHASQEIQLTLKVKLHNSVTESGPTNATFLNAS